MAASACRMGGGAVGGDGSAGDGGDEGGCGFMQTQAMPEWPAHVPPPFAYHVSVLT